MDDKPKRKPGRPKSPKGAVRNKPVFFRTNDDEHKYFYNLVDEYNSSITNIIWAHVHASKFKEALLAELEKARDSKTHKTKKRKYF